jgi:hypothetical protein
MNDLHESYMAGGELIYAARVDSVGLRPGRNRALLDIKINSQRIETVRIYWNDYLDSTDIAINNRIGMFTKTLENLDEREYIFNAVSFDKFGNRSLPVELTGTVYGDKFQNGLVNRGTQNIYGDENGLNILWSSAPNYALYSELEYKDTQGQFRTVQIPLTDASSVIPDWASDFKCRTLFVPSSIAIDTFYSEWRTVNAIPNKYPRREWTAESRNSSHNWGDMGGEPFRLFDGSRGTGWHTAPGSGFPQCLVVDMKASLPVHHLMLWHAPEAVESNWIYFKTIEVYLSDTPIAATERQSSWGEPALIYNYPGGEDGIVLTLPQNSKGQYLVLYFPDWNRGAYISFTELEVYNE